MNEIECMVGVLGILLEKKRGSSLTWPMLFFILLKINQYRVHARRFIINNRRVDSSTLVFSLSQVKPKIYQTYQVKSAASQVHDWVVYRLGGILGSVGHRVKIHKITRIRVKNGAT